MLKNFEVLISLRYLRSRNKEYFISVVSAFSLIGIALGVATLIIVMAVMNGYEVELIKRILGINGHITISSATGRIDDYTEVLHKIRDIPEIKFSAPLINEQVIVSSHRKTTGAFVRGMNAADIKAKPILKNAIKLGNFLDYQEGKGIMVGSHLAYQLGVNIGDTIKIIAPSTDETVIGSVPRMKTTLVVAIFDVGMYEYNASTIFMPLSFTSRFFDYQNQVGEIEIILKDIKTLAKIKSEIASQLPNHLDIKDWSSYNQQIINALTVERNVMFLILTLIIIVAAFNIISGLVMLVKEKQKNIAILRTIGMTKGSVIRIFMLSGSIIGFVGTLLGALIGISFSLNIEKIRSLLESLIGVTLFDPVIYYLTVLPAELDIKDVVFIISLSLLLSVIATIYPALRAASLMPAEALRYE